MKRLIFGFCLWINAWQMAAASPVFLESAVRSLPPRYLADMPMSDRGRLWEKLAASRGYAKGIMDESGGWIHYHSDGPPADRLGGTSMFWVKLLPVPQSDPLVFVHMSKPFNGGGKPARNQTYVLKRVGRGWKEVTHQVMPKELDLTMHFRPRRSGNVIEAAVYEKFERNDGQGLAYRFGERKKDLHWENGKFRVVKAAQPKLSGDDVD